MEFIAKVLYFPKSTLFNQGVHYNCLVQMDLIEQYNLGWNKPYFEAIEKDLDFMFVEFSARKEELRFYQYVAGKVLNRDPPPFLSWVFSFLAPMHDFKLKIPSYEVQRGIIKSRGPEFYAEPFDLDDVKRCLEVLKKGGNECSYERVALERAQRYLADHNLEQ